MGQRKVNRNALKVHKTFAEAAWRLAFEASPRWKVEKLQNRLSCDGFLLYIKWDTAATKNTVLFMAGLFIGFLIQYLSSWMKKKLFSL